MILELIDAIVAIISGAFGIKKKAKRIEELNKSA